MSGLLPRNQSEVSDVGNFNNLNAQTLIVSGVGFINNLEVNTFEPNSITTSQINGDPNLNINATTVLINGSAPITASSTNTLINKTIDSASNTLTITNAPLSAVNVNSLINQDVRTTSTPTFTGLSLPSVSNDNTITHILGLDGFNSVKYKNNVVDTTSSQILSNKTLTACGYNSTGNQVITFDTSALAAPRTISWADIAGTVTITNGAQTLSNKTIDSTNTINGCSIRGATYTTSAANSGILFDTTALGAPRTVAWTDTAGGTVALNNNIITFTSKTIDSASNTLTITNAPLSATNVNSLINQDMRTTSAPTFTGATLTSVSNDNTIVNILGLNGSNVVRYKNNVVDTTAAQTLTNKTLTAPVIATIINTGTLTLPTLTDTLVGRATTDTLTNKTLTLPTIASINNGGTLTLPTGPQTLVGRTTTDTLTGKTIDSASNTLTITNAPLSAVNVNSLINQDVRTSAAPTFTTSVNLTQSSNTSFTITGFADLGYSAAASTFFTNAVTGDVNLRNQNSANTLNLGVGTGTAQLQVKNNEIDFIPTTFNSFGGTTGKITSTFTAAVSQAFGTTTTMTTVNTTTNTAGSIYIYLTYRKLTGTITGYGSALIDKKYVNNAGTVTVTNGNNNSQSETAIAGGFGGKTTFAFAVSGTNINVNVTNTFTDTTLTITGTIETIFC